MKKSFTLFVGFLCFIFQTQTGYSQLTFWNTLELYYPFDGDALDYSGNELHGNATATSSDTGVFGTPNSCFYFNGSNSKVVRPILNLPDSSTFSAWYYSEADSQAAPLIYNGHTAYSGFGVFVKKPFGNFGSGYLGKTLVLHQGGVSESYFNNHYELPTNQWLHLALVRRGGILELYINGVFQSSAPLLATTFFGEFSIGASTDHVTVGYPAFKGKVDEVMVFSSALSAQNVFKVFQSNLTSTDPILAKAPIKLFPNPSEGRQIQMLSNGDLIKSVKVFDSQGRIIETLQNMEEGSLKAITLNFEGCSEGLYFIQSEIGGKLISQKLILK
jgi:hypothetical protein